MYQQSAKMLHSAAKDGKQPVRKGSFWGIRCESGKKYSQIVNQKYHISMAALDPTSVKNGKDVVSLLVEREGSEFLLCNLQKDSVLQVNLNLIFDKGEKVAFSLKGQGILHLTGYVIKDDTDQSDGHLQSKNLNDSIMLAKDKVKASGSANKNALSKKNVFTENDSWKVESKETVTPTKKLFASPQKKNSEKIQTNITGALDGDNWNVESEEDKSATSPLKNNASPKKSVSGSPSQKLTPQKKLFESSNQESDDSSEDDDDDDDDDEDDEDEESDDGEDAKQLLRFAQKRPIASLEDVDDSDSDDSSDDDYELPLRKKTDKDLQSSKKLKAETSTPIHGKKTATKNVAEVIDIDDDSKNGDMDSSIGRTPMPKKKKESVLLKSSLNESKKAKLLENKDSSDSDDEDVPAKGKIQEADKNKSASQLNTSSEAPNSEKKKKKKKKKKAKLDESTAANESSASVNDSVIKAGSGNLSKAQYGKKLEGGLEYEDVRLGNGPLAKKGRMVFVYYTGKLSDNTIFDSSQPGKSKPFSFKLGAGQVIKGWDLAVEGMKVGGRRRIKIPPNLGYRNQRTGPIPPNSTLYFVVDLKAVL